MTTFDPRKESSLRRRVKRQRLFVSRGMTTLLVVFDGLRKHFLVVEDGFGCRSVADEHLRTDAIDFCQY